MSPCSIVIGCPTMFLFGADRTWLRQCLRAGGWGPAHVLGHPIPRWTSRDSLGDSSFAERLSLPLSLKTRKQSHKRDTTIGASLSPPLSQNSQAVAQARHHHRSQSTRRGR